MSAALFTKGGIRPLEALARLHPCLIRTIRGIRISRAPISFPKLSPGIASRRYNTSDAAAEPSYLYTADENVKDDTDADTVEAPTAAQGEITGQRAHWGKYFDHHVLSKITRTVPKAREVVEIFSALPENVSALSPSDEKAVFDLLKHSSVSPRRSLLLIGTYLRNDPRNRGSTIEPNWGHLVPAILRMAWNDGKAGGPAEAAGRLVAGVNEELDPPAFLISKAEAIKIVDQLELRSPAYAQLSRRYIAIREFKESPEEEREAARERVLECLQKAWDTGHTRLAAKAFAELYEKGDIVPRDTEKSLMWRERAVEQGDYSSATVLGVRYGGITDMSTDGNRTAWKEFEPIPQDLSKSRHYFEITAHRSNPAMYYLALHYYLDPTSSFPTREAHTKHWGVEPDDARAAKLFGRGARRNSPECVYKLAVMILLGRAEVPGEKETTDKQRVHHGAQAREWLLRNGWTESQLEGSPLARPEVVEGIEEVVRERVSNEERMSKVRAVADTWDDVTATEGAASAAQSVASTGTGDSQRKRAKNEQKKGQTKGQRLRKGLELSSEQDAEKEPRMIPAVNASLEMAAIPSLPLEIEKELGVFGTVGLSRIGIKGGAGWSLPTPVDISKKPDTTTDAADVSGSSLAEPAVAGSGTEGEGSADGLGLEATAGSGSDSLAKDAAERADGAGLSASLDLSPTDSNAVGTEAASTPDASLPTSADSGQTAPTTTPDLADLLAAATAASLAETSAVAAQTAHSIGITPSEPVASSTTP